MNEDKNNMSNNITPEDIQAAYHNMQVYMKTKNSLMADILSVLLKSMVELHELRTLELQSRANIIKLIKDSPSDAANVLQDTMSVAEMYNECFDHMLEMLIPVKDAAIHGQYFVIDDAAAAAALNITLDEYLYNSLIEYEEGEEKDMSLVDEAEEIANQQYEKGSYTKPSQDLDDDKLAPV